MTTQHTPGPWRVNRQRIEYGPIIAGDGFCIAEVKSDPPPLEIDFNAQLIAAAPELLTALGRARLEITDPNRGSSGPAPALQIIDAALIKATQ